MFGREANDGDVFRNRIGSFCNVERRSSRQLNSIRLRIKCQNYSERSGKWALSLAAESRSSAADTSLNEVDFAAVKNDLTGYLISINPGEVAKALLEITDNPKVRPVWRDIAFSFSLCCMDVSRQIIAFSSIIRWGKFYHIPKIRELERRWLPSKTSPVFRFVRHGTKKIFVT